MTVPETRYAKTVDGVHIAYQVMGEGPDLVVATWGMNIDVALRWETHAEAIRRLASFCRVLVFDRRGTGASDHIVDRARQQSLEARIDDIRAVMDAAGSEHAVLMGSEDGFSLAAMFAASHPERTLALVGWAALARTLWAPDYPWAMSESAYDEETRMVEKGWGSAELARDWTTYVFPDLTGDEERIRQFAEFMRTIGGPATPWRSSKPIGTPTSAICCRRSGCPH